MSLPIHKDPIVAIGVMVLVLLVLWWLFRSIECPTPEAVTITRKRFSVLALVVVFVCGGSAVMGELRLDKLDELLAAKLPQAGITVLEVQDWGATAIIEKTSCIAKYTVRIDELMEGSQAWPLVAGTGIVISGCSKDELDRRFMPRSK